MKGSETFSIEIICNLEVATVWEEGAEAGGPAPSWCGLLLGGLAS